MLLQRSSSHKLKFGNRSWPVVEMAAHQQNRCPSAAKISLLLFVSLSPHEIDSRRCPGIAASGLFGALESALAPLQNNKTVAELIGYRSSPSPYTKPHHSLCRASIYGCPTSLRRTGTPRKVRVLRPPYSSVYGRKPRSVSTHGDSKHIVPLGDRSAEPD